MRREFDSSRGKDENEGIELIVRQMDLQFKGKDRFEKLVWLAGRFPEANVDIDDLACLIQALKWSDWDVERAIEECKDMFNETITGAEIRANRYDGPK